MSVYVAWKGACRYVRLLNHFFLSIIRMARGMRIIPGAIITFLLATT